MWRLGAFRKHVLGLAAQFAFVLGWNECVRNGGMANESRVANETWCLGGDVHLHTQWLTVGQGSQATLGSSARYLSADGPAWNKASVAIMVDHDLDGMQSNFKGDFLSAPAFGAWGYEAWHVQYNYSNKVALFRNAKLLQSQGYQGVQAK